MKWQLLHKAWWTGDRKEVQRLLKAGADPNRQAPTNWRQTPLGRTLEFRITNPKHAGHAAVVQALLDHGADPTVRSTHLDMTPYELASFCGLAEAADLLRPFQAKAQLHPSGMTELWLAAASRLPEEEMLPIVVNLAGQGNVNGVWRGATPLMMATGHAGHFQVADALLEAGADPSIGTSILHADWHFEYMIPALEYLARKGWDVDSRDASGQTALHKAAFLGYTVAIRTLLAFHADPSIRDANGFTPEGLGR